jgi:hypothetical protein
LQWPSRFAAFSLLALGFYLEVSNPKVELVYSDLLDLSDGLTQPISQGDQIEEKVVVL